MVHDGEDLVKHLGHKIEVVAYGYDDEEGGEMYAVAVECRDCNEVILEFTFWEEDDFDVPPQEDKDVSCAGCSWAGNAKSCVPLARLPYLGLKIKPGETVPYGGCPMCGELVYATVQW
jgi:hypothetical protein